MRSSRWHTSPLPYHKTQDLAEKLGVHEVLATVLARRGYEDPEAARRFLAADGELHNPFLFPEMQAVCDRLRQAASEGEKICVHGDYDVDGITATALLVKTLRDIGADADYHLPNRFAEGYGISRQTVERIAESGYTLLVTVDCGISARDEIKLAQDLGMDTIVIDHHQPAAGELPPAAIISPLICDYPFKELAGVGLAFKVAQGLIGQPDTNYDNLPDELRLQLDLVALGTIADVVPLIGENRSLVKRGLAQLARTGRPGLRALMEICQVEPRKLSAGMVAFRMAPRINAAGRLDDPGPALDLLLCEDGTAGVELATHLDSLNRERQRIENRMLAEAEEMLNGLPDDIRAANGYVLSSSGWHEGVIGIVASRMVEFHHRPVLMIAENGVQGKGSGRSIPAFDLHEALGRLKHLLAAFGGHRAACGLTIDLEHLDEFRREFASVANEMISGEDLHPRRYVDALVTGRELTLDLAQELSRLEPFGIGNPSVDLLTPGVKIKGGRKTRDGQHFQCQITSAGVTSSAIGFRQGYLSDKVRGDSEWDVIFRLEQNEFNGSLTPQLNLRDLMPRDPDREQYEGLCAHRCDLGCPDRVTAAEFWALMTNKDIHSGFLERLAAGTATNYDDTALEELEDRVIDRRDYGDIAGQIARLGTTGQGILLLTADVPRRRRLLSKDLPLGNLGIKRVYLTGTRCGRAWIENSIATIGSEPSLMLADFATALGHPSMMAQFPHIVFVDPPPSRAIFNALAKTAPAARLHLFYCRDEVQFTSKVLEHEFGLRAPMTKLYKQLTAAGRVHPFSETTERLLLAGGKYLRQPTLVARCMRVLEELALICVEEREGKPILVLPESGKKDLEESCTYGTIESFYGECQKFLNKSLNAKLI